MGRSWHPKPCWATLPWSCRASLVALQAGVDESSHFFPALCPVRSKVISSRRVFLRFFKQPHCTWTPRPTPTHSDSNWFLFLFVSLYLIRKTAGKGQGEAFWCLNTALANEAMAREHPQIAHFPRLTLKAPLRCAVLENMGWGGGGSEQYFELLRLHGNILWLLALQQCHEEAQKQRFTLVATMDGSIREYFLTQHDMQHLH